MVCGPWPAYYMNVALGPCNETRPPGAMPAQGRHGTTLPKERGCPEQCQLRGNRTGLRKILAAGAARARAGPPVEDNRTGLRKILAAGAARAQAGPPVENWTGTRTRLAAGAARAQADPPAENAIKSFGPGGERGLLLITPPRRAPRCASSGARRYSRTVSPSAGGRLRLARGIGQSRVRHQSWIIKRELATY